MSRTWFNFLCCSIKKQNGKQNRNVPGMKSRDRSVLQWVHGFCGECNGTVLVRFCLRGVGAASSLSCMWSHMFLSKVMRSLNLSTVLRFTVLRRKATWSLWLPLWPTRAGPWDPLVPVMAPCQSLVLVSVPSITSGFHTWEDALNGMSSPPPAEDELSLCLCVRVSASLDGPCLPSRWCRINHWHVGDNLALCNDYFPTQMVCLQTNSR